MRPTMKAVFTSLLRAAPFVLLPSIVLAAGGEEAGWRPVWDLVWRLVNFVILVGVLLYFARKPVAQAIRNSIDSVKNLIKEAEESRRASEARMKEAEEKLAGADREIRDLLEAAHREGEKEKERVLAEAAEALERLKAETAAAVEQELKKAKDTLRKETADAAVALAQKIISQNLTDEDQRRFVAEYLEKLEANQ